MNHATRRELLRSSTMGMGWLGLASLLGSTGELTAAPTFDPADPDTYYQKILE